MFSSKVVYIKDWSQLRTIKPVGLASCFALAWKPLSTAHPRYYQGSKSELSEFSVNDLLLGQLPMVCIFNSDQFAIQCNKHPMPLMSTVLLPTCLNSTGHNFSPIIHNSVSKQVTKGYDYSMGLFQLVFYIALTENSQ